MIVLRKSFADSQGRRYRKAIIRTSGVYVIGGMEGTMEFHGTGLGEKKSLGMMLRDRKQFQHVGFSGAKFKIPRCT